MKKILLMTICLLSCAALADELFPELGGLGGRQRSGAVAVEAKKEVPTIDAAMVEGADPVEDEAKVMTEMANAADASAVAVESQDLFAAKPQEETEEESEEEEEDEEEEKQRITVYMQDAKATITPNRDFSYCFGVLKFLNTLKRPVQALSLTLTYGGLRSNYNVRNLMPNQEQTGSISLMGEACEQIMDMPTITIKSCVVEDMSEAKCKKKVEFLPLRGE